MTTPTPITLEQALDAFGRIKRHVEKYGPFDTGHQSDFDLADTEAYITQQAERLRVLEDALNYYVASPLCQNDPLTINLQAALKSHGV